MLTISKLRNLLNENFLNSLQKKQGITEFFMIGNISIGISYENGNIEDGEEEDRYILNLFLGDEYLNISYEPSEKGLNDIVLNEVCDVFNHFFNIRSYLAEEVCLNFSKEEIKSLFGEVLNSEQIEEEIEELANKPIELSHIFSRCFHSDELGNMLFLLL